MGTQTAFLSAAAVDRALDISQAIDAIRDVYAAPPDPAAAPPRTVARGEGARLRTLSAILPTSDLMGAKLLAQPRSGRPTYLVALFDQDDGRLVALLDAGAITAVRTAATSAVALDALTPPQPQLLGVLGSGHEAHAHVRAMVAIREIAHMGVYSPTPERRTAFARWAQDELGVPATACSTPRDAVDGATTMIAAARSTGELPVLDGAWLRDDATVASIGSTLPEQRELDVATLERACLVVADEPAEVVGASGDGLAARAAGLDLAAKTRSLHELVGDAIALPRGIRVFKSVGCALQDVAVARLVLRRARELDLTAPVDIHLTAKER